MPARLRVAVQLVVRETGTMSKRLQVRLSDQEMLDIERLAKRESLTVSEWARRVLHEKLIAADPRLAAVRRAAMYSFPTADIDQMLSETGRGSI
jgi:hypothetical protein